MSKIEIEDGHQIPEAAGRARASMYPWDDMEVGQSFFVSKKNPPSTPKRLKDAGKVFRSARAEKGGEDGVRVWRVE